MRKTIFILPILLGLTNCNTIDEETSETAGAMDLPPLPEIDCDQIQTELGDPKESIDYAQASEICDDHPEGVHWLGSVNVLPQENPDDLRGMWCFCSIGKDLGLSDYHPDSGQDFRKGIIGLAGLSSLYGLDNLRSVGRDFFILGKLEDEKDFTFKSKLQHVDNLYNLHTVGRKLYIVGHPHVTDLAGLSNLENLGGLTISDMANLQSIASFHSLTKIGGSVWFTYLPRLASFEGFETVEEIDSDLLVRNLQKLKNFEGFDNLVRIGRSFAVDYFDQSWFFNTNVTTAEFQGFDGLISLREIGGQFSARNLDKMKSLSTDGALGNLSSVGLQFDLNELSSLDSLLIYLKHNEELASVGALGKSLTTAPVFSEGIFISRCNKNLSAAEANKVLQNLKISAVIKDICLGP